MTTSLKTTIPEPRDSDVAGDYQGQDLLQAAKAGDVSSVKHLAKFCPNLDVHDDVGNTPLMLLISNCQVDTKVDRKNFLGACSYMIVHGADVNSKNSAGMTSLMLVVSRHFRHSVVDLVELLIHHGADPDLIDARGDKALTHALRSRTSIYFMQLNVNSLLSQGADPFIGVHNHKLVGGFLSQIWDFKAQDRVTLHHVHQMIKTGKLELLRFLVCNCALDLRRATFNAFHSNFPPDEPLKGLSPLMLALIYERADIAKYFVASGYLTDLDLRREPLWLHNRLPYHMGNLMREIYSQPWPLVKLAFVALSALLGPLPERTDLLDRTKLPDAVKQLLLFQGQTTRVCSHQWGKLPVSACDYNASSSLRPLLLHWPHGRDFLMKCPNCVIKITKVATGSLPTSYSQNNSLVSKSSISSSDLEISSKESQTSHSALHSETKENQDANTFLELESETTA